jgi:hypothetical protein
MKPEGKLIEEVKLANGLSLFIYDQSRPVVGDRWLVQLLFFVPVRIKPEHLSHVPDAKSAHEAFVAAMGQDIAMEHKRLRQFIDHQDVAETLKQIREQILATTLPYVSHPEFAARFVAKRYREWDEQQKLLVAR